MTIHEHLTRVRKPQLREMGWTKARELVKVARRDGPERTSKGRIQARGRTAPDREGNGSVGNYLLLYKSQLPVVEKAIETAGLMLGTDKSRGYCLEMICADFLAGADVAGNEP